ncbi:MAG: hypothetical protein JNM67_10870 [Bacteroidetes bacterium]|nr:hypothetical protein [Bacteroidota bacterium]
MNTTASTQQSKPAKKSFYFTEILMLKSIIALLILTFFLLNEMQASNHEIKQLNDDYNYKTCSMAISSE